MDYLQTLKMKDLSLSNEGLSCLTDMQSLTVNLAVSLQTNYQRYYFEFLKNSSINVSSIWTFQKIPIWGIQEST
jgi:hypothetical protein